MNKKYRKNGWVLLSRFYDDGSKINDEAIRYNQIKKIYICGTGEAVCIETYKNTQYRIETENDIESKQIFYELVHFEHNSKEYLNLTRSSGHLRELEVKKDFDLHEKAELLRRIGFTGVAINQKVGEKI